jgi:hypothetical protein
MPHHEVWWILTNISEELAASIIRVMSHLKSHQKGTCLLIYISIPTDGNIEQKGEEKALK